MERNIKLDTFMSDIRIYLVASKITCSGATVEHWIEVSAEFSMGKWYEFGNLPLLF